MLIDGEKWACEACVRGHRVSNCQHAGELLLPHPHGPRRGACGVAREGGLNYLEQRFTDSVASWDRPSSSAHQQERSPCVAMPALSDHAQVARLPCQVRLW